MDFQGAVIREKGLSFAVVIVKAHVVASATAARSAIQGFGRFFPSLPVVLMAQDSGGRATYFGRTDIARFMANVPLDAVPWKEFTVS